MTVSRKPRVVASDLDGTLLHGDGKVSAYTVDVVRRVQDAGCTFVVVTARPPRWVHDLVDVIGDHGIAICSNGAFVYDVPNRQIMAERTIGRDVVLELVDDLRAAVPSIRFAMESSAGFASESDYSHAHDPPDGAPVGAVSDLLDQLPGKLMARAPELDEAKFLDLVGRVVGERAMVAFSGVGGLAEISAAGVTKAAVLADWCAERDVSADDVWAFGDMPNDLPMLTWAGRSFAVANAHRSVAVAATDRCPANDEDGVARTLDELLLGGGQSQGAQSSGLR